MKVKCGDGQSGKKVRVLFFNGIKYLPVILERSEESGQRWVLFFNGIKYLPVILERSEESRQRIQVLNTFCNIPCRILR